jgi:GxxExxY protein
VKNLEPQMNADERRLNTITERIIGRCYTVANVLGPGFLEKVYENALAHELRKTGLYVEQQKAIEVKYDGIVVGTYTADLLVARSVLVELKAVKQFDEIHIAQCLNYLRATGLGICLLVNFGAPKVEIRRLIDSSNLRSSAFIGG